MTVFKVDSKLSCFALSPDGAHFLIGGSENTWHIVDATTGVQSVISLNISCYCKSLAFSPDGNRIVSCDLGMVQIWDAATGAELLELTNTKPNVEYVYASFLVDGSRVISVSYNAALEIWDSKTGAMLHQFQLWNKHDVLSVALSPDGTKIALSSSDWNIGVWNVLTGQPVSQFRGSDVSLEIAFSSDGANLLTFCMGYTDRWIKNVSLIIYEVNTGTQVGSCTLDLKLGGDAFINALALSPNGSQALLGFESGLVQVFDIPSCKPSGSPLQWHNDAICHISFSPDGSKIVSSSYDRTIKIWDAAVAVDVNSDRQSVHSVSFDSDGTRVLVVDEQGKLEIWDAISGDQCAGLVSQEDYQREVNSLSGSEDGIPWEVKSVVYAPNQTMIGVFFYAGRARIWNGITATPLCDYRHDESPLCIAFSHDASRVVLGNSDGSVRVLDSTLSWDRGGSSFALLEGRVEFVNFSLDETKIVAVDSKGRVHLWDAVTGMQLAKNSISGYFWAISPDGTKLTISWNRSNLYLCDTIVSTGNEIIIQDQCWNGIVTFSPNSTQILTSGSEKMKIWDVNTGQLCHTLEGHMDVVHSVAFSTDGTRIVSGSFDQTVRVWDSATRAQLGWPLEGHEDKITCVAFSSDGSKIVSGSRDCTVRIWDVATCMQFPGGNWDSVQSSASTATAFNNDHENWTITDDG
ncbi:hypothetical protein GYMLUDRAFT_239481 [Collybiopsis luxurians FD-317 M1]|nr:hypothetical protein GYMLUDRAFT_239481 [Collybiopsis luxurians FD-317 M1]